MRTRSPGADPAESLVQLSAIEGRTGRLVVVHLNLPRLQAFVGHRVIEIDYTNGFGAPRVVDEKVTEVEFDIAVPEVTFVVQPQQRVDDLASVISVAVTIGVERTTRVIKLLT